MTVEQTTVDPAKVQATMGKVVEELGVALGTLTATLGWRAGLWQAMAGAGPPRIRPGCRRPHDPGGSSSPGPAASPGSRTLPVSTSSSGQGPFVMGAVSQPGGSVAMLESPAGGAPRCSRWPPP